MKLYLISQEYNDGYNTYDSAVVSAESEAVARTIHPRGAHGDIKDGYTWVRFAEIDKIQVEYLGETTKERGVILASFNAG